jgi:DNA ligase 4
MLPTPAPDSQSDSPPHYGEPHDTTVYNAPPENVGSAPFGVLVGLFEKLQNEKKPDRRRKLLDAWFNVWLPLLLV